MTSKSSPTTPECTNIYLLSHLRSAYEKLLQHQGHVSHGNVRPDTIGLTAKLDGLSNRPPPPPPLKSDYPRILYWQQNTYKNRKKNGVSSVETVRGAKGGGRAAQGINVGMLWIETEDGEIIDGHLAADMRRHARSIWRQFVLAGVAPEKWGQAGVQVQTLFIVEMETRYPVLALCDDHWKARKIATGFYPSFYQRNRDGLKSIKSEEDSDVDEGIPTDDEEDGTAEVSSSTTNKKRKANTSGTSTKARNVKKSKTPAISEIAKTCTSSDSTSNSTNSLSTATTVTNTSITSEELPAPIERDLEKATSAQETEVNSHLSSLVVRTEYAKLLRFTELTCTLWPLCR